MPESSPEVFTESSSELDDGCADWQSVSPETPDCPWCARYGINLDVGGAICRRCRIGGAFRFDLATYALARSARACPGDYAYCERFQVAAGPDLCARCREDPLYRAFLAGQRAARPGIPHRDPAACSHRGAPLRVETRRCCGGRLIDVKIYACDRRGEAAPETCAECPDCP